MSAPPLASPDPGPDPRPVSSVQGRRPPRGRPRSTAAPTMRVTAEQAGGYSVTVSGPDLDLRRVLTLLTDVITKIRKAQAQQMSLATFISLLRDQAALANGEQTGT